MSVNLAEVEDLQNKRVTIQYNKTDTDGEKTMVEAEGVLMAVSAEIGVMFRPRGHNQGLLIEVDNIESIVAVPTAPKKIKQKVLKEVDLGDVRAHLAERHGYPLAWANQASPEQAAEAHNGLDHADLGHKHGDAPAEAADVPVVAPETVSA